MGGTRRDTSLVIVGKRRAGGMSLTRRLPALAVGRRRVLEAAGTFAFRCTLHREMRGPVTVSQIRLLVAGD